MFLQVELMPENFVLKKVKERELKVPIETTDRSKRFDQKITPIFIFFVFRTPQV